MEVIKMQGEVLMAKRYWWQLYKKGWYKHNDLWGNLWWIKFKWDKEEDLDEIKNIRLWLKDRKQRFIKQFKNKQ